MGGLGREEAVTQVLGDVVQRLLALLLWGEFREGLRGTGPLRVEVGVG